MVEINEPFIIRYNSGTKCLNSTHFAKCMKVPQNSCHVSSQTQSQRLSLLNDSWTKLIAQRQKVGCQSRNDVAVALWAKSKDDGRHVAGFWSAFVTKTESSPFWSRFNSPALSHLPT